MIKIEKEINKKYENLGKVVSLFNELKTCFLMCEHFGIKEKYNYIIKRHYDCLSDNDGQEKLQTIDDFIRYLTILNEDVQCLIDKDIYDNLILGNYEVYTDKHHHRRFWNEIPMPAQIEDIFNLFKKNIGLNFETGKKVSVSLYDLSDAEIFFENEEELSQVVEIEDITPYTAFEIKVEYEGEDYFINYYELYSA